MMTNLTLIHHLLNSVECAAKILGRLEILRDAGDLPKLSLLHIGAVSLFVEYKAALSRFDLEAVKVKTCMREGKGGRIAGVGGASFGLLHGDRKGEAFVVRNAKRYLFAVTAIGDEKREVCHLSYPQTPEGGFVFRFFAVE